MSRNIQQPICIYSIHQTPVVYCIPKINKPLYSHVNSKNKEKYVKQRRLLFDALHNPESAKKLEKIQELKEKKMWEQFYSNHPIMGFLDNLSPSDTHFIISCISQITSYESEHKWVFSMATVSNRMVDCLVNAIKILCKDVYYVVSYEPEWGNVNIILTIYWNTPDMDDIVFNKYIFRNFNL